MDNNIFVFCGKSATGKSSIVKCLLEKIPESVRVKADTTRPKRGSKDREYNFISEKAFISRADSGEYVKPSVFRGWYYGLSRKTFLSKKNNFCIATPSELLSIKEAFNEWNVYVIYLDAPAKLRLERSIARKGRLSFEHLRRLITDEKDFRNIEKVLKEEFEEGKVFSPVQYKGKSLLLTAYEISEFIQGKILER